MRHLLQLLVSRRGALHDDEQLLRRGETFALLERTTSMLVMVMVLMMMVRAVRMLCLQCVSLCEAVNRRHVC